MALIESLVMFINFSHDFEPLVVYQYQSVAAICGAIFINIMACRVFRLLRLENDENAYSQPTSLSTLRFGEYDPEGIEMGDLRLHV